MITERFGVSGPGRDWWTKHTRALHELLGSISDQTGLWPMLDRVLHPTDETTVLEFRLDPWPDWKAKPEPEPVGEITVQSAMDGMAEIGRILRERRGL